MPITTKYVFVKQRKRAPSTVIEGEEFEARSDAREDAAGVHTAKAAPDAVSTLVEKWRREVRMGNNDKWTRIILTACANELEAALKGGKA